MNALPKLRTRGIGAIGPAIQNALAIKNMGQQNQLNALKLKSVTDSSEQAQEMHGLDTEQKRLDIYKAKIQKARTFLPAVTQKNYPDFVSWVGETVGSTPKTFMAPEEVAAMEPADFEAYKGKLAMDADDLAKMTLEEIKLRHRKPGETRKYQKDGREITQEWTGSEWKELGSGPKWNPDAKSPTKGKTRSFQEGGKTVTEEWDGKKWTAKSSGPKWNPDKGSKGKEPTEAQARAKLHTVDKYRQKLKTSGGMDDALFAMVAKENPELAKMIKGGDTAEIEAKLNEYEAWLKSFTTGTKDPLGIR